MRETWPLWTLAVVSICTGLVGAASFSGHITDPKPQLGSGAYPTAISVALIILGLVLLVNTYRQPVAEEAALLEAPGRGHWRAIFLLAVYLIVMPRIGFAEATGLFLLAYQVWVARYPVIRSVLLSIVVALALSALFIRLLPLGLPTGILEL